MLDEEDTPQALPRMVYRRRLRSRVHWALRRTSSGRLFLRQWRRAATDHAPTRVDE